MNGDKRKICNIKKLGIRVVIGIVLILLVVAGLFMWKQRRQRVLLVAFDDYNEYSWRDAFDLFDQYDVQVTFFLNATEPTDFCKEAIARGHEIGYHTATHKDLKEVSKEEFYEEAIAPIEIFKEKGIELTSFAYPYGSYEEWMNEELLKHYKSVRGAYHFGVYFKADVDGGFVESQSIDNVHFESDEDFRKKIEEWLDMFCQCHEGTAASVYSHAISGGDWCVSEDRLAILFEEAAERNIKCRTFNYLQR